MVRVVQITPYFLFLTVRRCAQSPRRMKHISGLEHVDKCIDIDQTLSMHATLNPATYTGMFTAIRCWFSGTQEARSRRYQPGAFSFNVKVGAIEACEGDGVTKVKKCTFAGCVCGCDVCHGKQSPETLEVQRAKPRRVGHDSRSAFGFSKPCRQSLINCKNLFGILGTLYIRLGSQMRLRSPAVEARRDGNELSKVVGELIFR